VEEKGTRVKIDLKENDISEEWKDILQTDKRKKIQ
jgi:hypothetical protein